MYNTRTAPKPTAKHKPGVVSLIVAQPDIGSSPVNDTVRKLSVLSVNIWSFMLSIFNDVLIFKLKQFTNTCAKKIVCPWLESNLKLYI